LVLSFREFSAPSKLENINTTGPTSTPKQSKILRLHHVAALQFAAARTHLSTTCDI
jgi:hypothetical protein